MTAWLLTRPWAQFTPPGAPGAIRALSPDERASLRASDTCLVTTTGRPPTIEGERGQPVQETRARIRGDQRILFLRPPLPVDPARGLALRGAASEPLPISWDDIPHRPPPVVDEEAPEEIRAARIMDAVLRMTARLREVELALEDPAVLWATVADRWLSADDIDDPTMDVIVRHARQLDRLLADIAEHPRRVLARARRPVPLSRVREIDRATMLWLVRQPGDTLAERAGPSQRLPAPVREEVLDTPENRVLHALARDSRNVARDWCRLNARAVGTSRWKTVEHYGRLCGQIARNLREEGVSIAAPDLRPNYVLQHDGRYRRVWDAWQELLSRRRAEDDMWRWQARTFDEFCLVALAVACHLIEGAEIVAAAPLRFAQEQRAGRWLDHEEPFVVFWLKRQGLILEIASGRLGVEGAAAALAPSAWIRVSDFGDGLSRRMPVWALHTLSRDGHPADEIEGMDVAIRQAVRMTAGNLAIGGAIALRFLVDADSAEGATNGPRSTDEVRDGRRLLALEFGPTAAVLTEGLRRIGGHLSDFVAERTA